MNSALKLLKTVQALVVDEVTNSCVGHQIRMHLGSIQIKWNASAKNYSCVFFVLGFIKYGKSFWSL